MKTKTAKPLLNVELLQSHFPYSQGGIKSELERAIRECEVFQTRIAGDLWIAYNTKQRLKKTKNKFQSAIYGKKSKQEKTRLFLEAIDDLNMCLQKLQTDNSEYHNLEPLQAIYDKLIKFIPKQSQIQLQINLIRF